MVDAALTWFLSIFEAVYNVLKGFVIIPNVLTLFDVILYFSIITLVVRFLIGRSEANS